jgi:hypothetical protein
MAPKDKDGEAIPRVRPPNDLPISGEGRPGGPIVALPGPRGVRR